MVLSETLWGAGEWMSVMPKTKFSAYGKPNHDWRRSPSDPLDYLKHVTRTYRTLRFPGESGVIVPGIQIWAWTKNNVDRHWWKCAIMRLLPRYQNQTCIGLSNWNLEASRDSVATSEFESLETWGLWGFGGQWWWWSNTLEDNAAICEPPM